MTFAGSLKVQSFYICVMTMWDESQLRRQVSGLPERGLASLPAARCSNGVCCVGGGGGADHPSSPIPGISHGRHSTQPFQEKVLGFPENFISKHAFEPVWG